MAMQKYSLFDLQGFVCHTRYARIANKTPRQKMAVPLFGFAHPPPFSEKVNRIVKKGILKIMADKKERDMGSTAYNGRFHASGGVSPQDKQYEIASACPAASAVNPRLREAAGTLYASGEIGRGKNPRITVKSES